MKLVNVYEQPSQTYRFEFTNIKPASFESSFVLMDGELYRSAAHTLLKYPFLNKVIPYENITE